MLENFANWLVYDVVGIELYSRIGEALSFFVYDSLKILLLLFVVSIVMGFVNAYFPIERLRNFLTNKKLYGTQYLLASLFGAITPFCSCSSIPLFIGFVKGGIPLGVTFSFLITSPLVNEVAVAMFLGVFGLNVTLVYIISGVLLGMFGGYILGKLKLERLLSPWVLEIQKQSIGENAQWEHEKLSFMQRMPFIVCDSWNIVKGVIVYVIIGIGIGACMHGYVPEGFFETYLSSDTWYAVPLAVICAVPMYANAAGIVPVVEVFVVKGVSIGTALAFMMAVVGLSLPEATLLKKVMSLQLICIFFGIITLFIMILGFFYNIVL